jgi:hypothetical protein
VDAGIDRADFDHLRADLGDEAAVRGAAAGRQLGFDAGFGANRLQRGVDQRAVAGQEGLAARVPDQFVVSAGGGRARAGSGLQLLGVLAVPKRKLNWMSTLPGMTLLAPVPPWMFEICQVVGGKELVAFVPDRLRQLGNRRRCEMDRVLRQMRVGDVALHALDGQFPRQRSAAPILDHVAEAC